MFCIWVVDAMHSKGFRIVIDSHIYRTAKCLFQTRTGSATTSKIINYQLMR